MAAQKSKARIIIVLIGISVVVLYYLQSSINQISVPVTTDQVEETNSSGSVRTVSSLDTVVHIESNSNLFEDNITAVNEQVNSTIHEKKQAVVTEENDSILHEKNYTVVNQENDFMVHEQNQVIVTEENDFVIQEQNQVIVTDENDYTVHEQNHAIVTDENDYIVLHEKNNTVLNQEIGSIMHEEKQEIITEDTEEILATVQKEELSCQEGYVFMENRILPEDVTHNHTGKIPKLIHFIVQSRCIPIDLANRLNTTWYTLEDHSIYFHDANDIQKFISRRKKALFPSIVDAYNCAKISRAKLEIARFFILWELGGISVDVDHIPHPIVLQENVLSRDDDECIFEVNKLYDELEVIPRYLACVPQHSVLYIAIVLFITKFNTLNECFSEFDCSLEKLQEEMYLGFIHRMKATRERGKVEVDFFTRNHFSNQPFFLKLDFTKVTPAEGIQLFTPIITNKEDIDLKILSQEEYENQCKAWMVYDENSFDVKMESLIEVLVGKRNVATFQSTNTTVGFCSSMLQYIPTKYDINTSISKSKVPKIIHMTSKTHCVTQVFLNNIRRWFVDGYSFFFHDDEAVDRLIFGREWPQFPLLTESLACITSGAGKADLWRYLLLWEYGGIYTDIDNAPGSMLFFANHTSTITDDMDAFFEQGKGGYPSQYFFASKYM